MKKKWIIFTVFGFMIVCVGATFIAVKNIGAFMNKFIHSYREMQHDVKYWDSCSLIDVFDRARVSSPETVIRYKKGSADALVHDKEIVKISLETSRKFTYTSTLKRIRTQFPPPNSRFPDTRSSHLRACGCLSSID